MFTSSRSNLFVQERGLFYFFGLCSFTYEKNTIFSLTIISAIAETRKKVGNDAFHKDDFNKAINLYTEGIEVKCRDEDLNAKLYNNRASAHYHLGKVSFISTLRIFNNASILFRIHYSMVFSTFIPAFLRNDASGISSPLSPLIFFSV